MTDLGEDRKDPNFCKINVIQVYVDSSGQQSPIWVSFRLLLIHMVSKSAEFTFLPICQTSRCTYEEIVLFTPFTHIFRTDAHHPNTEMSASKKDNHKAATKQPQAVAVASTSTNKSTPANASTATHRSRSATPTVRKTPRRSTVSPSTSTPPTDATTFKRPAKTSPLAGQRPTKSTKLTHNRTPPPKTTPTTKPTSKRTAANTNSSKNKTTGSSNHNNAKAKKRPSPIRPQRPKHLPQLRKQPKPLTVKLPARSWGTMDGDFEQLSRQQLMADLRADDEKTERLRLLRPIEYPLADDDVR